MKIKLNKFISLLLTLSMIFGMVTLPPAIFTAADVDFTGSKLIDNGDTLTLIIKGPTAFTLPVGMLNLEAKYDFSGATFETALPLVPIYQIPATISILKIMLWETATMQPLMDAVIK